MGEQLERLNRALVVPGAPFVPGRAVAPPSGPKIGEIPGILPTVIGVDGVSYSLSSFDSAGVLVLAFLADACPAVKACVDNLVQLQRRFAAEKVQVIGVNSNNPFLSPRDTLVEMARWATEAALNFPYVKDARGEWARGVGVTNTPHFVLLDRERRLRYRGRMFDSRDPARTTTHDLEEAVLNVLRNRPIQVPENRPLGCSIVW